MLNPTEIVRRRRWIKNRPVTTHGVREKTRRHADWCDNFANTAQSLTADQKDRYFNAAKRDRALADNATYLEAVVRINVSKNALDQMEIDLAEKFGGEC